MNLTIKRPFEDRKLRFDEDAKMYVLTLEYAKEQFGNPYQDDEKMKRRLMKNSRKVYNFIKYRCFSKNQSVALFMVNNTEQGREFIHDVLYEQFEADAESGFNDLSSMPAIVPNGQIIDREEQFANQVSVDAEQIVLNSCRYFGISLCLRTQFPWQYFRFFQENYE